MTKICKFSKIELHVSYVPQKKAENPLATVGKNARSSKTKMYKQKSNELSIITIRYMHKAKKTTPVPDSFLK